MTEKAVKSRKALKPKTKTTETASAKKVMTQDDMLKKLAKSTIPMTFVKNHNGAWNHEDWLAFLEQIKAKGYDPVDPDQVGLILEDKKAKFLAEK